MLRRLINVKPIVRAIEAHNGLSALVVEKANHKGKVFDAIWESSLTDSSSKGKPDIELVDFTSRTHTIEEIKVGAIVVATGYDLYGKENLEEYGYNIDEMPLAPCPDWQMPSYPSSDIQLREPIDAASQAEGCRTIP